MIMKKRYLKPETEVVEAELQQMVALSWTDEPANSSDALGRGMEDFEEKDNRKGQNIWDDEEDLGW